MKFIAFFVLLYFASRTSADTELEVAVNVADGHPQLVSEAKRGLPLFVPKTKIEIAVENALVDQVIDAVMKSAQTGKVGDGKIFVFDLVQVVRIRTGERDASAI